MADQSSPLDVVLRFRDALNLHDLDQLESCFHPEYRSSQPAHPTRSFQGTTQLIENWTWAFERFPDFEAEILDWSVCGETVWTEWYWSGTDTTGREIDVRGVVIFGVADDVIHWGRLYLEPVES